MPIFSILSYNIELFSVHVVPKLQRDPEFIEGKIGERMVIKQNERRKSKTLTATKVNGKL